MKNKIRSYSLNARNKKSYGKSFRSDSEGDKKIIWAGVFILIILTLITTLLFSNFFHFSKISIEGADNRSLDIESRAMLQRESRILFFSQKNIIFFNKDRLIKSLEDYNFSDIIIKKKIIKKELLIIIRERKGVAIFSEGDSYFLIDKDGNIIERYLSCDKLVLIENHDNQVGNKPCLNINKEYRAENLYPIIENIGRERFSDGKKSIKFSEGYLNFSLNLYNDFNDRNSGFGLDKIVLDEEYNTIKAKLNNNIEVYFNLKEDYYEQLSRFFSLKIDGGSNFKPKKYIDLRYGDKIFYY